MQRVHGLKEEEEEVGAAGCTFVVFLPSSARLHSSSSFSLICILALPSFSSARGLAPPPNANGLNFREMESLFTTPLTALFLVGISNSVWNFGEREREKIAARAYRERRERPFLRGCKGVAQLGDDGLSVFNCAFVVNDALLS